MRLLISAFCLAAALPAAAAGVPAEPEPSVVMESKGVLGSMHAAVAWSQAAAVRAAVAIERARAGGLLGTDAAVSVPPAVAAGQSAFGCPAGQVSATGRSSVLRWEPTVAGLFQDEARYVVAVELRMAGCPAAVQAIVTGETDKGAGGRLFTVTGYSAGEMAPRR